MRRGLAKEVRARERLGLPSRYLDRRELRARFDLSSSAAIVSDDSVAADPRALASGFLRRAQQLGALLFAPHEIANIYSGKRAALAVTKDDLTIQSRQVVFCTGYELPEIVPSSGHSISSTWVIATRPQSQASVAERGLHLGSERSIPICARHGRRSRNLRRRGRGLCYRRKS
jgi:glycine/D-amino acid oxidase-like deaminating enzyme